MFGICKTDIETIVVTVFESERKGGQTERLDSIKRFSRIASFGVSTATIMTHLNTTDYRVTSFDVNSVLYDAIQQNRLVELSHVWGVYAHLTKFENLKDTGLHAGLQAFRPTSSHSYTQLGNLLSFPKFEICRFNYVRRRIAAYSGTTVACNKCRSIIYRDIERFMLTLVFTVAFNDPHFILSSAEHVALV